MKLLLIAATTYLAAAGTCAVKTSGTNADCAAATTATACTAATTSGNAGATANDCEYTAFLFCASIGNTAAVTTFCADNGANGLKSNAATRECAVTGTCLKATSAATCCKAACTKPAGADTITCDDDGTNVAITACLATYAKTAAVTAVTAVTRACASTCTAVTSACIAGVDAVTAAAATCTACTGSQTGCAASSDGTDCAWANGPSLKLKCTKAMSNYALSAGGVVTACAGSAADTPAGAVATWKAQATAGTDATCEIATCNAGWTFGATNKDCTANACTATAVPAGYAATGIELVTAVTAVTGVLANANACPAVAAVTAVTGVTAVTTAVAASAATGVAGLGTVSCATGYTGTAPAGTCPVAAAAFVYTGCTAASPASVAQTIIAFVLTVVAMYL